MQHISVQYSSSDSILLVNEAGGLRRLYCPFRARCRTAVDAFKPGMWVWVDEVMADDKDHLLFVIFDKPVHHGHFEIKVSF